MDAGEIVGWRVFQYLLSFFRPVLPSVTKSKLEFLNILQKSSPRTWHWWTRPEGTFCVNSTPLCERLVDLHCAPPLEQHIYLSWIKLDLLPQQQTSGAATISQFDLVQIRDLFLWSVFLVGYSTALLKSSTLVLSTPPPIFRCKQVLRSFVIIFCLLLSLVIPVLHLKFQVPLYFFM